MRAAPAFAALLLASAAAAQPGWWSADPGELQLGDADGMGVTSRGRLFLAPRVAPVARPVAAGSPAHVWAAAVDASGNVFLATGPDGRIVRVVPVGPADRALHDAGADGHGARDPPLRGGDRGNLAGGEDLPDRPRRARRGLVRDEGPLRLVPRDDA